MTSETVLAVSNLCVEFWDGGEVHNAVSGVSFDVQQGETLGIVGESGSGKSVSLLALLGLIPEPPGRVTSGNAMFLRRDLLRMSHREIRQVRGAQIGYIFQDATTALSPVHRIGYQLREAILAHDKTVSGSEVQDRVTRALEEVGLPEVARTLNQYPHELSGGMRQRVMIATALINRPRLVIADEPTTSLDATVQAQVLDLLRQVQSKHGLAMIVISHDFGVLAEVADRIAVMYAGRIVESGVAASIFDDPRHPYTSSLLRSVPRLEAKKGYLVPIAGAPPHIDQIPSGCAFHPRCTRSNDRAVCSLETPPAVTLEGGHVVNCHFSYEAPNPGRGRGRS